MTAALTETPTRDWRAGFETIEGETPDEVVLPVQGSLPPEVAGTLFRAGPAGFAVGSDRYRHWFDGDGMVHAVTLGPAGVTYRSRWVATVGKEAEDAAGRRLFAGGFATPPPGGPLSRMRHSRPKNVANINVIAHAGALYALWEGGRPHRLDPRSLAAMGEDDLGGILGPNDGFSAHPKADRATGEVWNFGITYGARPVLSLYRGDADGCWSRPFRQTLRHPYMVHDMALTPRSVILVLAPVALPAIPVALLSGRKGYGTSLRYYPRWGTTILVVDRRTGASRTHMAEPFMVFHLAGAREEGGPGGSLEVDLCTYADTSVIHALGGVMDGVAPTLSPRLERLTVTAGGRVGRRALSHVPMEFPRPLGDGRVVGVTTTPGAQFLNAPAVVETATGETVVASMAPSEYAGEVVPVRGRWGLTLVLNATARMTELRVLDLRNVSAPAVASVVLPHMVPFGLHGNFVPQAAV